MRRNANSMKENILLAVYVCER